MNMLDNFTIVEGKSLAFFARNLMLPVPISDQLIGELRTASNIVGKNARICFHMNPEAPFHDMLVCEWKSLSTLGLHRHPTKPESLQIVDGEMYIDLGERSKWCYIGPGAGMYIPPMTWHSTRPHTEYVIYREIKPGPFVPSDNEIYTETAI